MTSRDAALSLVARARRRLTVASRAKDAARGALAGAAAGLVWSLLAGPGAWPWLLFAAGAAAGALTPRPRITTADAALYLDLKLGTGARFSTVATREPDAFTDRAARELAGVTALPRAQLPREAAYLPAAAFVLFAASLLPRGGGADGPAPAPAPPLASSSAEAAPPDAAGVEAALAQMQAGEAPSEDASAEIAAAIARDVARPEDRDRAREALDAAREGQAGAVRDAGRLIAALLGGAGGETEAGEGAAPAPAGAGGGAVAPLVYPDEEDFLRAYRAALAEERT